MSIPIWIKSEYVTIGNPPFFRLEGFKPSEKSEGKPPGSVVSHTGSISYLPLSGNILFISPFQKRKRFY